MMSISPLALQAKKVIEAAWLHGPAFDLASQAAFALESTQMLQSPETAAEGALSADAVRLAEASVVELRREHEENARLRARVAELEKRLHDAAMARTWRLENGKKFVYVEDIAPALLGLEPKPDGITELIAPTQALRGRALLDALTVERAERTHNQRLGIEDPHDSPLHRSYRIPHDLPELGGAR
ncbi:hypothetical protein WKI71_36845 [Streptomyces sp. MS1.AVA.1]|uniref:Uncharacterized protein n=1 Tax=Streptomyces machairae TaxID=3134109 RepID=A0ABU8USQ8_9ACTN